MNFQPRIIDLNTKMNELFMKYFEFVLDDTIIRKGRLKLFTMKEFNLKFFLTDDNVNMKTLEIPYPFDIKTTNDGFVFDYTIDSLNSLTNLSWIDHWEQQSTNKNRLYDKKLIIKIT